MKPFDRTCQNHSTSKDSSQRHQDHSGEALWRKPYAKVAKARKPRRYSASKGISGEGISGEGISGEGHTENYKDFAMTSSALRRPSRLPPTFKAPSP